MKKFIILLLFSSFCFGQNEKPFKGIVCVGSIKNYSEPLFVINDVVVDRDYFNQVNLDDIEEVTVLKDVSATALYGSSGRNGVIIVKTKGYITTSHDLIITELGFDSFLAQQNGENYYSMEYLKSKNRLYTSEWNNRVMTDNPNIYDMQIDYNSQTQYGLAFEYKLYQFFKFIEQKHSIKLI